MKLRTLILVTATGMVATGGVVWTATAPGSSSSTTIARIDTEDVARKTVAPPAAPPVRLERARFQSGKTLMVEGRLGHAVLPANLDSETYLFVDVSAADTVAKTPAPLDLSIVIDRSGSMAGKRLVNALAAARTAITRMRDGDTASVIAFNTETQVVAERTVIDDASRKKILAQLGTITAFGDTCISCGIDTAMRLLGNRDDMVKRILVLSDGQPTAGVRDLDGFNRIAESCRRMGASVTTIGVDVAYDEKVMSAIARGSNGRHFFVDDPKGLPPIFDKEMEALTRTIAKRAELTVDLAPGVFVEHVYDRVASSSAGQLVVPLGSFSARDHKTLLVRLRVPRGTTGERPVAAVRLRYDDLVETRPGLCEGQLATHLTSDASTLSPLDAIVSARLAATETARTLEAANDLFRAGRTADARAALEAQQTRNRLRKQAAPAAPAARAAAVDRSYAQSDESLKGAGDNFTGPGGNDPSADKKGHWQVKKSAEDAALATE
jgi:Ca-activated chloride channel family protein